MNRSICCFRMLRSKLSRTSVISSTEIISCRCSSSTVCSKRCMLANSLPNTLRSCLMYLYSCSPACFETTEASHPFSGCGGMLSDATLRTSPVLPEPDFPGQYPLLLLFFGLLPLRSSDVFHSLHEGAFGDPALRWNELHRSLCAHVESCGLS